VGVGAGEKALFLPDEHLGRNTGYRMASRWSKWPYGIHMRMRAGFPRRICGRRTLSCGRDTAPSTCDSYPNTSSERAKPIPASGLLLTRKCSWEVCQLADEVGSTEYIIKAVVESPPGSQWAVGHRNTLGEPPGGGASGPPIIPLDDCVCMCSTMYRISPPATFAGRLKAGGGQVVNPGLR